MPCPFPVQTPNPGPFDQTDLRGATRPLTTGPNKGQPVAEAYVPHDRFNDFYQGLWCCCCCCCTGYLLPSADIRQCLQGSVCAATPPSIWPRNSSISLEVSASRIRTPSCINRYTRAALVLRTTVTACPKCSHSSSDPKAVG